jgi:oleandomycin transport system ATP-binding protein
MNVTHATIQPAARTATIDPPRPADLAVEATGLVKRFGEVTAVDGIDLTVRTGEVFGVLGPNGAGKTTMLRMLTTLLPIDAGQARVFGVDVASQPHQIRQLVGVTGQYASVDENLTAAENLRLFGRLLGLSSRAARATAQDLLGRFGLEDAADRQIRHFSGGMRRRLDLAASLISRPPLIFLDEPTTGLDPRTRGQMWDTIRDLIRDGATVLLTTQYLDEADALADEITVIDKGRVIAHDTPDGLKRVVGGQRLLVRPTDPQRLDEVRSILGEIASSRPESPGRGVLSVPVEGDAALAAAVHRIGAAGIGVTELSLHLPSLDEVFFTLTGHRTEDKSEETAA